MSIIKRKREVRLVQVARIPRRLSKLYDSSSRSSFSFSSATRHVLIFPSPSDRRLAVRGSGKRQRIASVDDRMIWSDGKCYASVDMRTFAEHFCNQQDCSTRSSAFDCSTGSAVPFATADTTCTQSAVISCERASYLRSRSSDITPVGTNSSSTYRPERLMLFVTHAKSFLTGNYASKISLQCFPYRHLHAYILLEAMYVSLKLYDDILAYKFVELQHQANFSRIS